MQLKQLAFIFQHSFERFLQINHKMLQEAQKFKDTSEKADPIVQWQLSLSS